MRCDLIVELILNILAMVFQFLTGVALTSGFKDTCDAFTGATPSTRYTYILLFNDRVYLYLVYDLTLRHPDFIYF